MQRERNGGYENGWLVQTTKKWRIDSCEVFGMKKSTDQAFLFLVGESEGDHTFIPLVQLTALV